MLLRLLGLVSGLGVFKVKFAWHWTGAQLQYVARNVLMSRIERDECYHGMHVIDQLDHGL